MKHWMPPSATPNAPVKCVLCPSLDAAECSSLYCVCPCHERGGLALAAWTGLVHLEGREAPSPVAAMLFSSPIPTGKRVARVTCFEAEYDGFSLLCDAEALDEGAMRKVAHYVQQELVSLGLLVSLQRATPERPAEVHAATRPRMTTYTSPEVCARVEVMSDRPESAPEGRGTVVVHTSAPAESLSLFVARELPLDEAQQLGAQLMRVLAGLARAGGAARAPHPPVGEFGPSGPMQCRPEDNLAPLDAQEVEDLARAFSEAPPGLWWFPGPDPDAVGRLYDGTGRLVIEAFAHYQALKFVHQAHGLMPAILHELRASRGREEGPIPLDPPAVTPLAPLHAGQEWTVCRTNADDVLRVRIVKPHTHTVVLDRLDATGAPVARERWPASLFTHSKWVARLAPRPADACPRVPSISTPCPETDP